ncbi:MAG TPA: CcoQ/FixQ family Cbb3-type cytochrome c oxidase assembly chaperone [Chloroflexota bacterium]|nr:CcoQ/FixQ family Cbb3-type cytochrome c oxidase assembly chaperone [Chloroflexota bacterium]
MHLDFDVLSSVVTVVWFVSFIALCVWVWSGRRAKDYEAAARLPFDEPEGS